jgi:integrase/recombinase XerD
MSTLTTHVDDYLRMRRALGFKLDREQRLLTQFAAYVQEAGASTVTSNLAIAWARQPVDAQPNQWAKRLAVVRRFAAWLQTVDPATECPRQECSPPADTAGPPTCGRKPTSAR